MMSLTNMLKYITLLSIIGFVCIICFIIGHKSVTHSIYENTYQYDIKTDPANYRTIHTSVDINVIPMPYSVSAKQAALVLSTDSFQIKSKQTITEDLQSVINRYSKYISVRMRHSAIHKRYSNSSTRSLIIDCSCTVTEENKYPKLGEDESYVLNIDQTGIVLRASFITGAIRGLTTFLQLIEHDPSGKTCYVPFVNIVDRPQFPWRGLLLDASRHWLPMSIIERTLNGMELSKLNVLHFHLSDDQGFRAESVQYPLLHDRKDYFSQKDLRHIVEFARQRRIRVVPEFDVPGHTTSWFVGYPELAVLPGPYKVETRWGVAKSVMDPTKETTYTFIENFFKEMIEIFPDPYFHIGGDEVEGSQWMESAAIQKFIFDNHLENKNGLQGYFNRRIQTILKKYNRIMIGWEEIIHEVSEKLSIDKDAVIQTWLNRRLHMESIKRGYKSILSNGFYLDHLTPAIMHYNVEMLSKDESKSLTEEQQQRMLGGEMCMWTEYTSEDNIDSRLWPRSFAIAERFWSPSSTNNQKSLYKRLFRVNHLLNEMHLGFTHLSLYKQRLETLISDPNLRTTLLHPFTILANACEPKGIAQRQTAYPYSALVPLTTFADALQAESESIWKLENLSFDDQRLHHTFKLWLVNHIHLQKLFEPTELTKNRKIWVQDVEQLSKNLAHVGQIGLRVLNYLEKKVFHQDKNDPMNSWTLSHWISHHNHLLDELENGVREIRLAAVRPVRRLLNSIALTR